MALFVQLAILVGTTILNALLTPKVKRGTAPDLEFPDAEEGKPVPILYGTQAVSPNIISVGDIGFDDDQSNGGKFYKGLMVGSLCLGAIDEIVDIQVGGKSLRLHPFTKDDSSDGGDGQYAVTLTGFPGGAALPYTFGVNNVTFEINARQLFGGAEQEGGVEGKLTVHRGSLTDTVDAVTAHLWTAAGLDGSGTSYPGLCYAVWGAVGDEFYFGKVPQPKTPVFILRITPDNLGLGGIGTDANPAEILFDLCTHRLRGLGLDPDVWINGDSFSDAGATLASEGLGLSCTFRDYSEAWDYKEDIERHIQGALYQHPTTALWTLSLARPVTPTETVSRSTASDLVVTRPSWRDTVNEIKLTYRRYDDTPLEGASVVGEVLTDDLNFLPPFDWAVLQAKGQDLTAITVHNVTQAVDLVEGTDYRVQAHSGVFFILNTANTTEGDEITVDYTNGSAFVGYREATVQAQDLANQQATGEIRSESYEYPFFTNETNAQIHAGRLLKLRSRPLAKATWTETRGTNPRVVNDVVAVTWTPQGDAVGDFALDAVAFRIVRVGYGTLEEGRLEVEAIEDVFGIAVNPGDHTPGYDHQPGTRTAPGIAISQAPTSAIRVCLFPSDENFLITLERAEDAAFTVNLTTVASGLAGTTDYYDDTIAVGQTRYYRAKLTRTGYTDGAWSTTLTAVAVTGTPGSCTCTEPTITQASSSDGTTGTLTLTIGDEQGRVTLVEFRTRTGLAAFGDWATDSSVPYGTTVTLDPVSVSRIEWRVTYQDCAGDDTEATGGADFTPGDENPPETTPPEPGLTAVWLEVPLYRSGGWPYAILTPGAARVVLGEFRGTEEYPPLAGVTAAYLTAVITDSELPVGAFVAVEYEDPATPGAWFPMEDSAADDAGPMLPLDPASLDLLDTNADETAWNVRGDSVDVLDDAAQEVRVRAVIGGGDDTGVLFLHALTLWVRVGSGVEVPPEVEPPITEDPGSCAAPGDLVTTYASQAAAFAAEPTD